MSEEKISGSKLEQLKNEAEEEIKELDQQISVIDQMKDESIEKLEGKKLKLKNLSDLKLLKQTHEQVLQELQTTQAEIEARKLSITMMDQTILDLDEQISKIQAEHDRVLGEISVKKNRLMEKVSFYDQLKDQITNLVKYLEEADELFNAKVLEIEKQKQALKNNPDLSPEVLEKSLKELDEGLLKLHQEYEALTEQLKTQISEDLDPAFKEDILEEIDLQMTNKPLSEAQVKQMLEYVIPKEKLTEEERIILTKMGLIITPSERIIMKDDQVLTVEQVRQMGILDRLSVDSKKAEMDYLSDIEILGLDEEREEEIEDEVKKEVTVKESKDDTSLKELKTEIKKFLKKQQGDESITDYSEMYAELEEETKSEPDQYPVGSFVTQITSLISDISSAETEVIKPDVEYLKRVFGKVLSLGLAEITQVQPFDPIHYLAHWLFKYRYNQEIEEVKQRELDALLIERERIDRERTHEAIEAEAKKAVIDAWLRAEGIIMDLELAAVMGDNMEGEEEGELEDYNFENDIDK